MAVNKRVRMMLHLTSLKAFIFLFFFWMYLVVLQLTYICACMFILGLAVVSAVFCCIFQVFLALLPLSTIIFLTSGSCMYGNYINLLLEYFCLCTVVLSITALFFKKIILVCLQFCQSWSEVYLFDLQPNLNLFPGLLYCIG